MPKINGKRFVVNSIALKSLRNGWKHLFLYKKEKINKSETTTYSNTRKINGIRATIFIYDDIEMN